MDTIIALVQQLMDKLSGFGGDGNFFAKIIETLKGLFESFTKKAE